MLHAAKVMPTQWRSISAIVGRTAAQCLERYEKLLDAATGGLTGMDAAEAEDARRLRPGELDTSPENKPALPDAVDMEEEEKEMLQEARARMANTSGKKAKRKAREKAMEEGRRLSVLQRKRELKAAGILDPNGSATQRMSRKKMKKFGPDYNAEVPYYHAPAAGFHDVSDELAREAEQAAKPVDFRAATAKAKPSRAADIEERRRKADLAAEKAKIQADPLKALEELHKAARERLSKIRRASQLTMASPQLTDSDLKTLSKMAYDPELDPSLASGSNATRGLLAPYSSASGSVGPAAAASSAASRTPAVDPLMAEASHQAYQRTLQTPLLGHSGDESAAAKYGTSQLKPGAYKDALSTPNPLATPLVGAAANNARYNSMGTPSTNHRDHFGLNTSLSTPGSMRSSREVQLSQAHRLQAALSSLPAPKHTEFSIALPDLASPIQYSRPTHAGPIDIADIERNERIHAQMRHEDLLRSRSAVLKRGGLPRPAAPPATLASDLAYDDEALNVALQLIDEETLALIRNDCAHWPLPGHPAYAHPNPTQLATFNDFELDAAKALLQQEIESIQLQAPSVTVEEFTASWNRNFEETYGVKIAQEHEEKKTKGKKASTSGASIQTLQASFDQVVRATNNVQKKIEPLEKKLSVVQGGFGKRYEMITKELDALVSECVEAQHDLTSFEAQMERESLAQPQRLEDAKSALDAAKTREKELQARYQRLMDLKQAKNGSSNAAAMQT